MTDIHIRIEGRAGRITLDRPKALNALTYQMCLDIDAVLVDWADADIDLIIIDASGEKAFCAGGDLAEMYASGTAGDFDYGRQFWRDEYRMNERMFAFPKPVVTFLQGFTMGGGVGAGCHGSHRIVGETSQIAMPECGVGLVPDVGGSLILARAPGRLGEYLGTTATRMDAGDAIYAGFADYFLPESAWDALKTKLIETGDVAMVDEAALPAPQSKLKARQPEIDALFAGETFGDILRGLPEGFDTKPFYRNSPIAMAVAIQIIRRVRGPQTIRYALDQEFRYTFRSMEQGDFLEGIRAAIIDKDRSPKWAHTDPSQVSNADVLKMTLPLGKEALVWEDTL